MCVLNKKVKSNIWMLANLPNKYIPPVRFSHLFIINTDNILFTGWNVIISV